MKKVNAIHVGISGFPVGSAGINKCMSTYEVLAKRNINVLIINNKALYSSKDIPIRISKKNNYNGLNYQYTTPSPYRANSFVKRRYYNIIGRINEFLLIINLCIKKRMDLMFFYPNGNFFELLYYRFFSIVFGFPLVSFYDEYRSAFEYKKNIWRKLNDILFDNYFMKFVDGIFPISEFLIENMKRRGFKGDFLKIPPLVDFNLFKNIEKNNKKDYFLFAGSLVYEDSVGLILDAFDLVDNNKYYLYLIVIGSDKQKENLEKKLKNYRKRNLIKIFSNLDYKIYLETLYSARGLLIPLINRIQDKARFPQKISEYTATGNPIISTNFGEIEYYFKDNYNALLINNEDPLELSNKMDFIIRHPEKAYEIGIEGYNTGLKYFDINSYSATLSNFIIKLIKKND